MPRICVVGAGVVGLTTAALVQEAVPAAQVTLVADRFEDSTTSIGAGGIFTPGPMFRGPSPEITWKWLTDGFEFYSNLLNSPSAAEAGVTEVSGYRLSRNSQEATKITIAPLIEFRFLSPEEVSSFHGAWKYGSFFKTLLVENKSYLPYLMKQFRGAGGRVRTLHVSSFDDFAEEFDVICNCSGLGARKLCGDDSVIPVRGQVFQVKAPWIKHFVMAEQDTHVVPGIAHITVGGTRQFDNWNLEVDKYDSRTIWEKCCDLVPSLKNAKVVREWVGLRPFRPVVRVERELITLKSGRAAHVVHNYGHGGYGVLAAPGTSMHAVRLVKEVLNTEKMAKL